jgi:hypothetical protein
MQLKPWSDDIDPATIRPDLNHPADNGVRPFRMACGVSGINMPAMRGTAVPLASCKRAKARRTTRTCWTPPLTNLRSAF